jgi:hypothetical protein
LVDPVFIFAASPQINDCVVMTDKETGKPRGFAFVQVSFEIRGTMLEKE